MNSKRSDWSRPLPRRLVIPDVMTLRTLAGVRKLISHVPAAPRRFETWQAVEIECCSPRPRAA